MANIRTGDLLPHLAIYRLAIERAPALGYAGLRPHAVWYMVAGVLNRVDLPELTLEQAAMMAEGLPYGAREIYEACQPPIEVQMALRADATKQLAELFAELP